MSNIQTFFKHVKHYVFLGLFTLIPISLISFIFNFIYKEINREVDRVLPTIAGYKVSWLEIFILFLVLYAIGLVSSYVLGKKAWKVTRHIADLFPHVKGMNKELRLAQQIQLSSIPPAVTTPYFDIAVDYVPCNMIGGDIVQYHFYDEKTVVFIIGDVTGHGVPAALLASRLHLQFADSMSRGKQPGSIMKAADGFVAQGFKGTNMYFTAFCGMVDLETGELTYSNYGHLTQYLFRGNENKFEELMSHTAMLGFEREATKTFQSRLAIGEGDRLVLFTDGIPETVGRKNERFGLDRLKQEITKHKKADPKKFQELFLEDLWHFTEQEYEDDLCLMTLDIRKQ